MSISLSHCHPSAHCHHPWSMAKTWSWLVLKHLLLIPFSHSGWICCESALHAWLNREEKLDPINSSSMFLCCFRVVRARIATNTQAARSRRSRGFVPVRTALFQNATNSQPTPDDVLATRISMAHITRGSILPNTSDTNLHFRRPEFGMSFLPSQHLHHALSTFHNFEQLTMDTRCKACAPVIACGTELRDGT